jgi:hypothetical protein
LGKYIKNVLSKIKSNLISVGHNQKYAIWNLLFAAKDKKETTIYHIKTQIV